MNVLITGGAGFLGRRLAERLLEHPSPLSIDGHAQSIDTITLVDLTQGRPISDRRVASVVGDIADEHCLRTLIDTETSAIFHLAAVVSGQAEADFDLGMRINLDATRRLLEVCRALGHRPRLVFTSSVAVYGGGLPDPVPEGTALTPVSSYGTEKAIGELLVNDYSRRGFVDGRSVRLPTISVRPGKPNAALSSFASSIIRDPVAGEIAVCPVSPETRLWLLSPRAAVECLTVAHNLAAERLGGYRSVNLPGFSITVREMVEALARVAGPDAAARIRYERDPRVERIAGSWPPALDTTRAEALGFPTETNFDDVIRQHMADARAR